MKKYIDYSIPNIVKCNLGTFFGYRNEIKRLSLPCSRGGFLYGGFSKIFDNYDNDTKKLLLSQRSNEKHNNKQVPFAWEDWKYPKGRKGINDKLTMKRAIVNHFPRFMHLEHYRDLIKSDNLKYFQDEAHGHQFYSIPSKWKKSLQKLIKEKMELLPTTKED